MAAGLLTALLGELLRPVDVTRNPKPIRRTRSRRHRASSPGRLPSVSLVSGPVKFLDEMAARLAATGVHRAVARRDSAPIFDWLMTIVSLQGIGDRGALGWDAEHGGITWAEVIRALDTRPSCPRLRSWGQFRAAAIERGARPAPSQPTSKGVRCRGTRFGKET